MTRQRERGQVLVIFAGGLVAFLAVAALVFDVGQDLLNWRAQRNAADASALAGVRYMTEPGCKDNSSVANCPDAYAAAFEVARLNGYGDLDGDGESDFGTVTVFIPPSQGPFAGEDGFIEVHIETVRLSFFAQILGIFDRTVHALAVAGNDENVALDYSMVALKDNCSPQPPARVHGTGEVTLGGLLHVNGDCDGALDVAGAGKLVAPECDVAGTVDFPRAKGGYVDCTVLNEGASQINDPLLTLPPPPFPGDPADVEVISGRMYDDDQDGIDDLPPIPQGCPGSTDEDGNPTEATASNPTGCRFIEPRYETSCLEAETGLPDGECGPKLYPSTCEVDPDTFQPILDPATCDPIPLMHDGGWDVYRINDGAYWGGLFFSTTTGTADCRTPTNDDGLDYCRNLRVYMDPGVFWIGGGGFKLTGGGVPGDPISCALPTKEQCGLQVITVGTAGSTTPGRGVLIYNTQSAEACAAGIAKGCAGEFQAVGAGHWLYLYADDEGPYPGLLYFQDRDVCERFRMESSNSVREIGGTIYVSCGEVKINGGESDSYAVQIIAWEFDLGGSVPFNITYDPDLLFGIPVSGLVQ